MPERGSDLARTADWLFVALACLVVVVDGVYGLAYGGHLDPAPRALLLVLAKVEWFVPLLALGAVAAAAVAAGARSPRYAVPVVAAGVPLAAVHAVTLHVLPWNQYSYWIAGHLLEFLVGLPAVGKFLARAVFGAPRLGPETLRRAFLYHYAVVAVAAVAAAGVAGRRGIHRRIPAP